MKIAAKIVCVLLALAVLAGCGGKAAAKWQEQYDLGVKYVSEGNYKEAIIALQLAIEIDPKQVQPYLELADIYVQQAQPYHAVLVLQQAAETLPQEEEIRSALEQMRQDTGIDSVMREERDDGGWQITARQDGVGIVWRVQFDAEGVAYEVTHSEYDADGNRIHVWHWAPAEVLVIETEYDPARPDWNRSTRYDYDNETGALTGWQIVEQVSVNERFQDVYREMYDADGTMQYYWTYTYDENGFDDVFVRYYPDGSVDMTFVHECDAEGGWLTRSVYDSQGRLNTLEEYYEDGWTQTFYDDNGQVRHQIVYD